VRRRRPRAGAVPEASGAEFAVLAGPAARRDFGRCDGPARRRESGLVGTSGREVAEPAGRCERVLAGVLGRVVAPRTMLCAISIMLCAISMMCAIAMTCAIDRAVRCPMRCERDLGQEHGTTESARQHAPAAGVALDGMALDGMARGRGSGLRHRRISNVESHAIRTEAGRSRASLVGVAWNLPRRRGT